MGNQQRILDKLNGVRAVLDQPPLRCYLRTSRRGVPHLVVEGWPFSLSICYFLRRRLWKVFWPWPSGYGFQRYEKLRTAREVIAYVKGESNS